MHHLACHLSLYPKKFQRKQAFNLGNSSTKTSPWKLHNLLLYTPRNSTSFLIDPWNFHMFFLQYPSMSATPTPVWIFSGIAHFGEFRSKTYSFTENCECQLKSSRGLIQKTIQKMSKNYQNLDI